MGLEGQVLLLLVADAPRQVGHRLGVDDRAAGGLGRGAHRVLVDHRVRDVGDAAQVVGRTGRDGAEHDLLGDAPAEQDGHLVDELVARLEVGVLVGEVHDVAQRPPAGHDRDLVHAVGRDQELAAQRVPGLVVGDDAALVVVERRRGLHAGDHALQRVVEVPGADGDAAAARAEDRRLVADVGQVGTGQAAGLLGHDARARRPRAAACRACGPRGCARDRPRRAARRTPGGRSGPGAAARGRASRAGWRRPSRRSGRSSRSRPSRPAAG